MGWWIAAAVALLMSLPCGVTIGARIARGGEAVWQPQVLAWLVGFHGLVGVAALYVMTLAR